MDVTTGFGLVGLAIIGWISLCGLFTFTLAALSRRDSGNDPRATGVDGAFLVESRHENANVFVSPYGVEFPVTAGWTENAVLVTDAEIHSL